MDKLVEGKKKINLRWAVPLSSSSACLLLLLSLRFPPLVLIRSDSEGEFALFLDWTSNSDNDCIPEEDFLAVILGVKETIKPSQTVYGLQ